MKRMVMENTEKKIGAFVSRVWFLLKYGSYLPNYSRLLLPCQQIKVHTNVQDTNLQQSEGRGGRLSATD